MLGGADIKGLSLKIIKSLSDVPIKKVIVINDPKLLEKMKDLKDTKILHKPSNEVLVQNMARSSLAITTASMSLYELHYLKTKTVIVAINKNQESGAKQVIQHGLANEFVNIENSQWDEEIAQEVTALSKNRDKITSFIDGKGVERIYSQVLQRLRG
jgi:spore coat polysaccharide biosynthesis predicted glycosyltransferase SpsG